MARFLGQSLVVSLILLVCVQEGFSKLQCFRCDSTTTPECSTDEISKRTDAAEECPNHTDMCVKHVRSADLTSSETVMRGCSGKSYCDDVIAKFCGICSEDYCNSSISLRAHLGIIGAVVIVIKFYF